MKKTYNSPVSEEIRMNMMGVIAQSSTDPDVGGGEDPIIVVGPDD